jgi:hypothetical protein
MVVFFEKDTTHYKQRRALKINHVKRYIFLFKQI